MLGRPRSRGKLNNVGGRTRGCVDMETKEWAEQIPERFKN